MNVLIWWTNQEECESVTGRMLRGLPEYIQAQYQSRFGRPGRGRLWISSDFDGENISVDPWPDTPLAKKLAEDSGGIVFNASDLDQMSSVPGDLTNLKLIDLRESGPGEEDGPWAEGYEERTGHSSLNSIEIDMESTERGFERGEFTDLYGHKCSIQDSSLATQPAIWLGVNDASPEILIPGQGWTDVEFDPETLFHTRMHLSIEHAEKLVEVLQRFIETGSIGEE